MEERIRILKMLEEGKINAQQAEELLDSIEKKIGNENKPSKVIGKKLRVKVVSEDGEKVNICIPLSLAKLATGFVSKSHRASIESAGVDLSAIIEHIDELQDMGEDILNVESDNESVKVYIE